MVGFINIDSEQDFCHIYAANEKPESEETILKRVN